MSDEDKSLETLNNQQLMPKSEWDSISQTIRDKMVEVEVDFGDAPQKYIYTRKGAGNKDWSYVRADFFEDALHKHFPDWSIVYDSPQVFAEKENYPKPVVVVNGRLTFTIEGVRRVVGDVGEKEVEFTYRKAPKKHESDEDVYWLVTVPNQVTAAATNCFKRCCVRALRLARNVYREKDEEHYAQFKLNPADIQILENHQEVLGRILERATGNDIGHTEEFLQKIDDILREPDEATRYEVLDLLKESKNFQDTFTKNWRKENENEKR